jgi:CTP synthase
MRKRPSQMKDWRALTTRMARAKTPLRIGVIGKYFSTGDFLLSDAYLSVLEAIKHAAWHEGCTPQIEWLNAEHYETHPAALRELASFDGILIPGGFGARGIEGKIAAIEYVRTHNIPFLGLCYGLQCAVIECARNLAHLPKAHTTEIDPKTPHPVVHILAGQEKNVEGGTMGGTLRLGAYPCVIEKGSVAHHAYKALTVSERHRHRFEVNSAYHDTLRKAGLRLSGLSPDGTLVEIVELPKHPFFVGVQFHPEFQSSPMDPHPLFRAFAKAARERHAHSKH